jgi:hypothetical protein
MSTRASHHRFAGTIQPSLRSGFNGYFALSSVTGLFCHRRSRGFLLENLTPASGRQDHTTSPSASLSLVLRHYRVHRIPYPTFVTTRTPLSRGQDRTALFLFLPNREAEYFCKGDWTTQISLNRLDKSPFTRTRFPQPRAHQSAASRANRAPDLPDRRRRTQTRKTCGSSGTRDPTGDIPFRTPRPPAPRG